MRTVTATCATMPTILVLRSPQEGDTPVALAGEVIVPCGDVLWSTQCLPY